MMHTLLLLISMLLVPAKGMEAMLTMEVQRVYTVSTSGKPFFFRKRVALCKDILLYQSDIAV